ncbi:hypothetical protein HBA93_18715, partial [Ochrobactrum sp. SFR4]
MKNNRNIFFFKMILLHTIVLACSILMITGQNALSQPISVTGTAPMIRANDWSLYSEKFLSKEGRIMDDANGNISH